jgi:hypothetical protein
MSLFEYIPYFRKLGQRAKQTNQIVVLNQNNTTLLQTLNKLLERLLNMSTENDAALDNIGLSLNNLSLKFENLGAAVADEILQVSTAQTALSAKIEELNALIAADDLNEARVTELTSELALINQQSSAAAQRANDFASRIAEIGAHAADLEVKLLADDPSDAIPNLPPASPKVAPVEDGTENADSTPDDPDEPAFPEPSDE